MSSHELEENSFHRSSGVPWELLFLPVMEVTAPDRPFGFLWEIASSAGSTSYFAIRRTWNGPIVSCRGLFPWLSCAICKEYSEGNHGTQEAGRWRCIGTLVKRALANWRYKSGGKSWVQLWLPIDHKCSSDWVPHWIWKEVRTNECITVASQFCAWLKIMRCEACFSEPSH
jgi:hypothetical protein